MAVLGRRYRKVARAFFEKVPELLRSPRARRRKESATAQEPRTPQQNGVRRRVGSGPRQPGMTRSQTDPTS